MKKILIIEDELVIRELLSDNLGFEGFITLQARDLGAAERVLKVEKPDLIMLDINLPDGNGAEWLTTQRKAKNMIPTIICTIRDREIDVVKALDAGADDYITKPFRVRELIARVKAVLRRIDSRNEEILPGNWMLNFSEKTISKNGNEMSLTTTEWKILEYLYDNRNRVVSRNQIMDRIWGIDDLEDSRAVDVHVGRLRRKLEAGIGSKLLVTVRGFGFCLKLK